MPDYQTSKIYKLSSPSNNLMYIGSTTQTLAHRLAKHKGAFNFFNNGKRGYLTAFKILECGDYKIELIENYPCNNKEQLFKREGEHIKNLECVNKRIEGRTEEETKEQIKEYKKEYREANKEQIKEYREANKEEIKQRREANKEQKNQYNKQYRESNKERLKEYREANKEQKKQYYKQYRESNKEQINKRRRDQRKQKKEENQGTETPTTPETTI